MITHYAQLFYLIISVVYCFGYFLLHLERLQQYTQVTFKFQSRFKNIPVSLREFESLIAIAASYPSLQHYGSPNDNNTHHSQTHVPPT